MITIPSTQPAEKPELGPYTIWSPSQFLGFTPDPSANLLGDGFISSGEWTSLIGIGGLGKTRLSLWLLICQITGRDWCGLPTHGLPQKCLLLSTESGLRRCKSDLTKIMASLSSAEQRLVEGNLRIMALTPEEEGDLNLGDAENIGRLMATLKAENPGIVVFDPFADMVDGDENATVDIVATLRTLRGILRATVPRAAIVIIHHARTGPSNVAQAGNLYAAGNFGRGAKALYSKVRCELQLAPGDSANPNALVLACGKANDTEKFKPKGIVFDPDTFNYSVDPDFNEEAWRADLDGKRSNKSVSVAEVVVAVQDLCPHPDGTVKAGAICVAVRDATGASVRTIKGRISEAVRAQYLSNPRFGVYALGAKSLKK